jgi:hypothetical protein
VAYTSSKVKQNWFTSQEHLISPVLHHLCSTPQKHIHTQWLQRTIINLKKAAAAAVLAFSLQAAVAEELFSSSSSSASSV